MLAEALKVPIAAVDSHAPFLAQLETEAERRGLRHLIRTRCEDFGQLDDAPGSYDVLWAEGSIYNLGWKEGLTRWRRLLAPTGLMAATEATWLTDARPPEAVAFWKEAYPSMGTLASNIAVAQEAGYQVLDTFPLPPSAWWDEYYRPLQARMDGLRAEAASDPALAEAIGATRQEIDVYAHSEGAYGYVFYLLRAS